jgi:hypothetical protein
VNSDFPAASWKKPETPEPSQRASAASEGGRQWWARLWRRVRRLLSAPDSEARDDGSLDAPESIPMPEPIDIHEPSEEFVIDTPALGDAFDFKIRVRCSWCVQATALPSERQQKIAEVRKLIEKSRPTTKDRIEEHVRPVARKFPPYRAAEAEDALNEVLVGCLSDGDVQVKIRTWVDVSDPIRTELQKVWRQRLTEDTNGDRRKAYAELLGELQESWQQVLFKGLENMGATEEAKTGWLAPYALALAENPKNAPRYLTEVLTKRVDHAEQLLAALSALALNDQRLEDLEFVFQSESALRALLVYLGVPVPSAKDELAATVDAGGGAGA